MMGPVKSKIIFVGKIQLFNGSMRPLTGPASIHHEPKRHTCIHGILNQNIPVQVIVIQSGLITDLREITL